MRRKTLNLIMSSMVIASSLTFSSCGNSDNKVEYLPFKKDYEEKWGLIDFEGNILLQDEFKVRPSEVRNGVFYIKSDGKVKYYTADKDYQQIGEYRDGKHFYDGLAPVVEDNQHIKYIDSKGDVEFELTKHNEMEIIKASIFSEGIANIIVENNKMGCINKSGKVIIEPIYDYISDFKNGYALAEKEGERYLINKKGEEVLHLDEEYKINSYVTDDVFAVRKDGIGWMNIKGEIVKDFDEDVIGIMENNDDYSVFMSDDYEYGVMKNAGDVVIKPKYDELKLAEDVILFKDKGEWGILSYDGEVIKDAEYREIVPFVDGNSTTFAKDGKDWIVIDKEGKQVGETEFERLDIDEDNYPYVSSDYIDYAANAKNIISLISDKGIDNVSYGVAPQEFINAYGLEVTSPQYKDYISTQIVDENKYTINLLAQYNETIAEAFYEGLFRYRYEYKNIPCQYLALQISSKSMRNDQIEMFGKELFKQLAASGYAEITVSGFESSDKGKCFQINDHKAYVIIAPSYLTVEIY